MPPWHVMGTACARAKSFVGPSTLADAVSEYRLLAHDRPRGERRRSPDFAGALVLRGDGCRAPAVRRRAATAARDGQEIDAGPASRSLLDRGAGGGLAPSYAPSSFRRRPEPKKS